MEVIPWREVEPLDLPDGSLQQVLASVDTLRSAWKTFIKGVSDEEFAEARQRSLRRHAIETGIVERLYDVSWGVTEALIAEGLVREVAEREGGITDDAFQTIQGQFEALEFLAAAARDERRLSIIVINDLHKLITRHQSTYEGTDVLRRRGEMPLHHGQWKKEPNHVYREDGPLLQYAPPEQVQQQMERLLELFEDTENAHPLIRAAWLHHQFICIHPFEDGNGRVARGLVLLVLLEQNYAPLVVDRNRRDEYIRALDSANDGDLGPLVHFFAQLEIVALRSEIELPVRDARVGETPAEVARSYVERLRGVKLGTDEARAAGTATVAAALTGRIRSELDEQADSLEREFTSLDPRLSVFVESASPPEPKSTYWGIQLRKTARAAGFSPNLTDGTWWTQLGLIVLSQRLRYVVAVQKVGPGETGVLAVTVFVELVPPPDGELGERALPVPLFAPTSADSVTLTGRENLDDRWPEVCELIERTLAASVVEFARLLG